MASENESGKREALADIVAEIRHDIKLGNNYYAANLPDRIEAAANREKAEIEAEALAVGGIVEAARHKPGNAAAMREALVEMTDKVLDYLHKGLIQLPLPLEDATAKARNALSAAPCQCDVGTPEELEERFKHFCASNYSACDVDMGCCRCPLESEKASCVFAWAQMPYATNGGGAE